MSDETIESIARRAARGFEGSKANVVALFKLAEGIAALASVDTALASLRFTEASAILATFAPDDVIQHERAPLTLTIRFGGPMLTGGAVADVLQRVHPDACQQP